MISGVPQTGYITAKKLNAYKLNYFGFEREPSVSLTTFAGTPELKVYICQGEKCFFIPAQYRQKSYHLLESVKFNDKQLVEIDDKENACLVHSVMIVRNCTIYAVVDCETSNSECKYLINYSHGLTQTILYEK